MSHSQQDTAVDFEEVIATIERRDGALRVRAKTFKSAPFVDVRFFKLGTDGQLHPTAKGCSVRVAEVEAVAAALTQAAATLRARQR